MTRRDFVARAAMALAVFDPERLTWRPGARTYVDLWTPAPLVQSFGPAYRTLTYMSPDGRSLTMSCRYSRLDHTLGDLINITHLGDRVEGSGPWRLTRVVAPEKDWRPLSASLEGRLTP